MTRFAVVAALALVAILVFHRPASAPPAIALGTAPPRTPAARGRASVATQAVVYVVGAVRRPGLYRLHAGSRVADAVERAGGFAAGADPAAVNLAQPLQDGQEVDVVRPGEAPAAVQTRARPASRRRSRKRVRSAAAPATVDLNAADAATLATLPGIGDMLAARIVEFRRLNGSFASLDELADVAGMTQRRIDAITPYVTLRAMP